MYDSETLQDIREQLQRAADHELYAQAFTEAGIEPGAIDSWAAFQELPFTDPEDVAADIEAAPPAGSLYEPGSMVTFSPLGDDLAPMVDTRADLAYEAEVHAAAFERAGLEPGDRVANTFGYHLFGTGEVLQRGLEELGAEVFPLGPGDSEQAAELIEAYEIDCLLGNPSFAQKIADQGATVETFVGAGEPFTSVPGYREQLKAALGAETAIDYFGTRQFLPIAVETAAEDGLRVVEEYAIVELVDPDTGEALEPGQRGELVVTHRRKEGMPLVRYRTGDLAELERRGDELVMPEGVIGRTDDRLKVKGVKLYPKAVPSVLAGFEGLTGEFRLEVDREATDRLTVVCEGTADREALRAALADRLLVSPDEVRTADELEETGVVDHRY